MYRVVCRKKVVEVAQKENQGKKCRTPLNDSNAGALTGHETGGGPVNEDTLMT